MLNDANVMDKISYSHFINGSFNSSRNNITLNNSRKMSDYNLKSCMLISGSVINEGTLYGCVVSVGENT